MAGRLEGIRKARLAKLDQIKGMGINPYPASVSRTHRATQVESSLGKKVAVAGRVSSLRSHGGSVFADLQDESGNVQIFFSRSELNDRDFELVKLLDAGDFIGARGEVFKTHSGEVTVRAKSLTLLTKSISPLPTSWSGLRDLEARYRQRYADLLLNPKVKETFLIRSQFIKLLREWFDEHGFIEVETPILQPLYGGASARPFTTHHNALDTDLYLRISDELYLKRLVVGGFEKVYEIGHDFRNEGTERGRNPEFTQLEFYWAYADYVTLMDFTEALLSAVIGKIKGSLILEHEGNKLDFSPPLKRITYRDLLFGETGIDIEKVTTERELLSEIKKRKIKVDLRGVAGYGALLDAFYKRAVRPRIVEPVFVTDRPVEMVPLAKRREDNPRFASTFQLVVIGEEFINAYNELNDPVDQRRRWEEEGKLAKRGLLEHQMTDEDYLRALEYGMPPTAGWGMGIDRFLMLLTGEKNIKDVILFPTLRPEARSKENDQ